MNAPAPKQPSALQVIHQDITSRQESFAAALPAHIPPAKFMRVVLTAIANSKDLADCTRKSIVNECMKAAQDGLVLDGREAVLIKFNVNVGNKTAPKWEAQAKYIPMYAGLMKKARNSGELSSISAVLVHKNDQFSYNPSVDEVPAHSPDWFGDRGEAIGVYAVARLKDGTTVCEIMSAAQVRKIGDKTKNAYQYDPEKGDSYGEWWRKTVIRRISKYLPSSTDKEGASFLEAVQRDDDLYDVDGDEQPQGRGPDKAPRKRRAAAGILNAAAQETQQEPEPTMAQPKDDEPDRRHGAEDVDPETGEVMERQQDAGPDTEDDLI